MRETVIAGVGMTSFGKFVDRSYASLTGEAISAALCDSNAQPPDVQQVYYSNSTAGIIYGQESVRGQHAIRGSGLDGVPLINVENACASGATALNQAWLSVASGHVDVAIAVGCEKLNSNNRELSFAAMQSALDQTRLEEIRDSFGPAGSGSVFMDYYANLAKDYMARSDTTPADFAQVAVKNHAHGSLNPKAQYGGTLTVDDVLSSRSISEPLTLMMCAPMSDGAAAAVLTTPAVAARWQSQAVMIRAIAIGSGAAGVGGLVRKTAERAYEAAAIPPSDIDVVECHDAASPAELIAMEDLDLCPEGEAVSLLRAGATQIGGDLPVNPSGGLESRGHPVAATGLAQIVELADQLRGRCAMRQVEGARIGLAKNAGGYIGPDAAAAGVVILSRM
jgi:acetyl-CoA acetyltransferase